MTQFNTLFASINMIIKYSKKLKYSVIEYAGTEFIINLYQRNTEILVLRQNFLKSIFIFYLYVLMFSKSTRNVFLSILSHIHCKQFINMFV